MDNQNMDAYCRYLITFSRVASGCTCEPTASSASDGTQEGAIALGVRDGIKARHAPDVFAVSNKRTFGFDLAALLGRDPPKDPS